MRARREVRRREKILQSQLESVIGCQFAKWERSRSGLGISDMTVRDHEGGAGAPARMELKRGSKMSIRESSNVWYHSYGMPSGPGARRGGKARMAVDSSSA